MVASALALRLSSTGIMWRLRATSILSLLNEAGALHGHLLYMEFHLGGGAREATAQTMIMAYQHSDVPAHTV